MALAAIEERCTEKFHNVRSLMPLHENLGERSVKSSKSRARRRERDSSCYTEKE